MNEKQLDQMPVHQLIELKSRIEKMIEARIKREREALLRKLDAIRGYEAMTAKSTRSSLCGLTSEVVPLSGTAG